MPDEDLQPQPVPEPSPPTPAPEPVPDAPGAPAPEPAPEPEPKQLDWRDREIARLRRINRELRAAPQPTPTPTATPTATPDDIETRAQNRAREIAAEHEFNLRCQAAAEAGRKEFGAEFDQRVRVITNLVDKNDPSQVFAYNSFLLAALETGEAPKLIAALGSDPDEAARVMALPPAKMAVELTRMSLREPQEISRAPRPIRPIATTAGQNRSPINPDDPERADQLDMREWIRRREAQVQAIRQSGRAMR